MESPLEDGDMGQVLRKTSLSVRELTIKDKQNLQRQDIRLVTSYVAEKLEKNARKYWDQFYNRNKAKFFKDRHWTTREFDELLVDLSSCGGGKPKLLEVGCGVGNLIFPLVEEGVNVDIFACDFSPRAVEYVRSHKLRELNDVRVFEADITNDDLLNRTGVLIDLVTLVFVLSAVHPSKFETAIKNVYKVIRPGGMVLFRDYGIHDMTQIRFKPGHKISDNFYMRQDGTCTYFFSIEKLNALFNDAGFQVLVCNYIECRTVNKKEGINVPRVFIQAKFKKPENGIVNYCN